jgi:uncharacterized membrane protein YphA (DoxX/SURF4 family)
VARIPLTACVFLVILRLSIGWQMLYEGMWKLNTLTTASPWSAEPYLKNATGPMRDYFRSLTGDPDDLAWLNYDTVAGRWDTWATAFASHYNLSDAQRNTLFTALSGPPSFQITVEKLPDGLVISQKPGPAVYYDPATKKIVIDGKRHLMPAEKKYIDDQLAKMDQNDPVVKEFKAQFNKLYQFSARLSFKERLLVSLKGNPKRAGSDIRSKQDKDLIYEKSIGDIEVYEHMVDRIEAKNHAENVPFKYDHLAKQTGDVVKKRSEVIGPVKALDAEVKDFAQRLLTTEQLAAGPVRLPMTQLQQMNLMTMWGLAILGALLIAGLWTRLAALGGAVMIFMFYLAYPPIPGYPEPPGVEHGIIVNKNLIEVLALLGFVFLPSGRWFGIDAIFARLFARRRPA